MQEPKLFLLDAYALIFRAYYAFARNPLINSKGMNVSAINGFTSTLLELMAKEKPTHLAVVFDLGKTHRATEHDFYKANRQETPEDISMSVPWIKEIIKGFHIPILEFEGYEADDIIGTIAKQKAKEGHQVFMVTPDKDFAQLVEENIFIYKPARAGGDMEILGVKEVCEQWEIKDPKQVIDILGMWGDAVDNIPGIPSVGEKTAKKLIGEYGSMENVIANADKVKGKLGENIRNFAEQGLISKKLATIDLNVPISVTDENLKIDPPNKERLAELFSELEFRTLGKKVLGSDFSVNTASKPNEAKAGEGATDLFGNPIEQKAKKEKEFDGSEKVVAGKNISNTPHQYHLIDTEEKIKELAAKLLEQKEICFDTETSSLDYFTLEIVGLSFSFNEGEAYYVPCSANQDEAKRIVHIFKSVLESDSILKIGQNVKFDLHVLRKYDVHVALPVYDTMLAHYLIEPDMRHGMDLLSESYLGYSPVSIETLIGKKGKNQGNMRDVELDKITEYAAEDADITLQLKHKFAPMIMNAAVDKVLNDIEHPLIEVLAGMEYEGVKIDRKYLEGYSAELQEDLAILQDEIHDMAGIKFNIDSPKQMGEVLFKHLKLPQEKKTSTGQASTGEEVLLKLAGEYPIANKILNYRELAKLKSTYVDSLPLLIHPATGRIHTTFNQTIAATGRLSSINPNLQNIPIKTERGKQVRKAFIPRDENHIIVSADYSQIELRLVAELAKEENMLKDFKAGLDIHTATAARVFKVTTEEVTKEMRSKAKMVNFGIIYSISAFGLSQRLGIPRKEAAELIENYFQQYPGIKQYMTDTLTFARENGFVKTIMGRRRNLKDINSKNFTVRGFAEREAINAPVQGSAADMIKIAMIDIHHEFKRRNLQSKMTLQVHDELVFDALESELDIIRPIIAEKMINAIKLEVPIEVEVGVGRNWLDAH
jgi:DNA polymerase-1